MNKQNKITADEMSKIACNKLREVFKESMAHPTVKGVDFYDDNNVIKEFTDEWTWYMQGWKDTLEYTSSLPVQEQSKQEDKVTGVNNLSSIQSGKVTESDGYVWNGGYYHKDYDFGNNTPVRYRLDSFPVYLSPPEVKGTVSDEDYRIILENYLDRWAEDNEAYKQTLSDTIKKLRLLSKAEQKPEAIIVSETKRLHGKGLGYNVETKQLVESTDDEFYNPWVYVVYPLEQKPEAGKSEEEISGLKIIREYFDKNKHTTFEHWAVKLIDKIISIPSERKAVEQVEPDGWDKVIEEYRRHKDIFNVPIDILFFRDWLVEQNYHLPKEQEAIVREIKCKDCGGKFNFFYCGSNSCKRNKKCIWCESDTMNIDEDFCSTECAKKYEKANKE